MRPLVYQGFYMPNRCCATEPQPLPNFMKKVSCASEAVVKWPVSKLMCYNTRKMKLSVQGVFYNRAQVKNLFHKVRANRA